MEKALSDDAINEELASRKNRATWVRDDSPASQHLPTHVILKVKRNADALVDSFRGRTVARGNHQRFGQDYMETYATVVPFSLVRIFMYLMLCLQMIVAQDDVKTVFLNGDLKENEMCG